MSNNFFGKKRTWWTFSMITLLGSSLIALIFMMYRLENMEESLISEAFTNQEQEISAKLNLFIQPARDLLDIYVREGERGGFRNMNIDRFNEKFLPVLEVSDLISSIMLATKKGNEFLILDAGDSLYNRRTVVENGKFYNAFYTWKKSDASLSLVSIKEDVNKYNPIVRPWFQGALQTPPGHNFWTQPYEFFTTKDPGVTMSRQWIDQDGDTNILGFDILLNDLSRITTNMMLDKNGKVFIISEDQRLLGCPNHIRYSSSDSLKKDLLTVLEDIPVSLCQAVAESWMEVKNKSQYFKVIDGKDEWICKLTERQVDNLKLYIGQLALVEDFNIKLGQTRMMMTGGLALIVLFLISLIWAYRNQMRANAMLSKRRDLLELYSEKMEIQRDEIKNAHRNTLDSIRYARRIQKAILPSKEVLNRILPDSFVYLKPRDVVSGDFYWFTGLKEYNIAVVADCTGHGVPGALMSILGFSFLEELIEIQRVHDPAKILNGLRSMVISAMRQTEDGSQKDGMDIAVLAIDKQMKHVAFAGAKNPLYVIRDGELTVYRGNSMSISYEVNQNGTFHNHEIQLKKGDTMYLFSDGFVDQFGGPNNKKYLSSRFKTFLLSIQKYSMDQQKEMLHDEFMLWKGEYSQIDDVCVLGVRV